MNTIHDELVRCCKELRIASTMADRAMIMQGDTNQEYLLNLLKSEVNIRKKKAIDSKLNESGIPYRVSFDDIIRDDIVFPESMSFQECRELKFYIERRNVIMFGNNGTGKTMLSISIAVEASERNIKVLFYHTSGLIRKISDAYRAGSLNGLMMKLSKASILILDEFGSVSYDHDASRILFDYLSEVITANRQIIVVNTDKPFSRWSLIFGDRDLAKVYVSRLTQHSEMILFPGRDRRMHDPVIMRTYHEMVSANLEEEDNEVE